MIVTIRIGEVYKLSHIFYCAYLNADQKWYKIKEEPLYSYDKEKRNAKKKELDQCLTDEHMYLEYYHYWDNLIGYIHPPQIPYNMGDIGTVDINYDKLKKTVILLHDMLLDSNTGPDIQELSSAYNYWVRVSEGDIDGN